MNTRPSPRRRRGPAVRQLNPLWPWWCRGNCSVLLSRGSNGPDRRDRALGEATYESLARKRDTMTTAEMATYAYDQIDQARATPNSVSK
jgi:hypothetical protein